VVVVAGVVWSVAGRDDGVLPDEQFVSAYRVVYSVVEAGGEERTEERLVKRPYWSRVVSERDGTVLAGVITNDDGRWLLLSENRAWQLRDERRQRPPDDLRPIDALEAAVGDGRAEQRGTDVVLGRTCTVIRTGGPLGGSLKPPTTKERADLCVDRTGVVLREEWMLDGRRARLMVATRFEVHPALDASHFRPSPEPAAVPDDAPGVIRVRAVERRDSVPVQVRGVDGFGPDGPPLAVERNVGGFGVDVTISQAFVKDGRLVVAEQGRAQTTRLEPTATAIDLGRGVVGHLELGLSSSALTVSLAGGQYVRLRGVELDVLEAFATDIVRRLE
jgi:hypothetical protein